VPDVVPIGKPIIDYALPKGNIFTCVLFELLAMIFQMILGCGI